MSCAALSEEVSYATATDLDVGVLFDRLLDAVVIARLSTGRIELWNPAAEKLFGFSALEAIGQSIEILMPEPIADVHRLGYERYMRTGHGLIIDAGAPVEMPARTKSGDDIRIELSLSQLQNSSGERFVLAVIRDAMNHKRLELTNLELSQARVARSEAEAAVVVRDELLDGVTATLQAAPDHDELQRLAIALGDFRRLHTGQLTVSPQDGDLVDLASAAVEGLRRRARGRRVRVHTPPRVPATFDAPRTRQVLEQVLDEAWHRTPDGAPGNPPGEHLASNRSGHDFCARHWLRSRRGDRPASQPRVDAPPERHVYRRGDAVRRPRGGDDIAGALGEFAAWTADARSSLSLRRPRASILRSSR